MGNIGHKVHHHLWRAVELLAQLWILGGNPDRAGVLVADTGHNAAFGDHCAGAKTIFVSPQHGGDHHIAARGETAVSAQGDTCAQPIGQQGLVGLSQPDLPRQAGIFDAAERAGPRTAIVPANVNHIGIPFDHTGSNRANANLGDQFYTHLGRWVDRLQVEDQLGEIFNAVDIVVGRRADQRDAGCAMAQDRNFGGYLMPW